MPELIVTRGLPGSGKSYWAKAWVQEDVTSRARVERDALRLMMHDGVWKGRITEDQVVLAQLAMVSSLLTGGVSVVVSDTNLHPGVFNQLKALSGKLGVDFKVQDFTDVPLSVCLERNAARSGKARVPDEAIYNMHERYIA